MKDAMYVRILRLRATPGSTVVRRVNESGIHVSPIQNGNWIEGELIGPIRVGSRFKVRCLIFDGHAFVRTYESSQVILIEGDEVTTRGVTYKVLRVPRFDATGSLRAWD